MADTVAETIAVSNLSIRFNTLYRPNLHLSSFDGVLISFPGIPVDTIGIGVMLAFKILAIQVGMVTVLVPPSAMVAHSTVRAPFVVVTIFGSECSAIMISKGVSCIT